MFSSGALSVLVQIVFGILLSEGICFVYEIVLRVDMSLSYRAVVKLPLMVDVLLSMQP